jgi:hypothetical protein
MHNLVHEARHAALGVALVCLLAIPAIAQDPPDPTVDRVTVKYSETGFELVSTASLVSVLPPSDDLPGEIGSLSGFWFELQDPDGVTLYRRVIGDPVRLVFEGPAQQDDGMEAARISARRVPSERKRSSRVRRPDATEARAVALNETGAIGVEPLQGRASSDSELLAAPERSEAVPAERYFALLIPLAAEGDELVLFSSPIDAGAQAGAATEVARFELRAAQP